MEKVKIVIDTKRAGVLSKKLKQAIAEFKKAEQKLSKLGIKIKYEIDADEALDKMVSLMKMTSNGKRVRLHNHGK